MRWYHDHSHGRTNRNSWMGLRRPVHRRGPARAEAAASPAATASCCSSLTTRTLDDDNQLVDPFTAAADPGADAVGSGELHAGERAGSRPYHRVEPTTYRLRILNAASFNPYNLGFAEGPPMVQIGNESGLFPAPAQRERVLMGPAERCDLVVDFSAFAGQRVLLGSAPQDSDLAPGVGSCRRPPRRRRADGVPGAGETQALQGAAAAARGSCFELPEWVAALPTEPDRTFVFGQATGAGGGTVWTINGEPYDHERIVARPELGSTETWMLVNSSQQSHYIHLHAVDWKVISRNGGVPAPDEDVLKETFRLDPGETLAVGAKFTDHLGRFLIHCHMLSHEDHAMMTTFEIVAQGAGDRTARRSAAAAEAVVRGERVRVPLDTLTPAEAERTRALAGRPAVGPGPAGAGARHSAGC